MPLPGPGESVTLQPELKSSATGKSTIGETARRFGLANSVLRYWEDKGVLRKPARVSGRRVYGPEDELRIALILLAKDAGLSLPEIRELQARRSAGRRKLLERKIEELDKRIAEATAAKRMAVEAAACRAADPVACPHFRVLLKQRVAGAPDASPVAS